MFIEQVKTEKFNFLLYLPIPVLFLVLMLANYFASMDVNTEEVMHQTIAAIGVNATFVFLIIPLSLACIFLLIWVKVVHRQSITSLTTSRAKIDWKRVFFSFGLWGFVSVGLTLLVYFSHPENFKINFQPVPFFTFLILAVILVPLQTSFEEYLFRGYLMQGLGVVTNSKLIPLLVTSIMFGLMHIANPEVGKMGYIILIYYIGTGFFLGIITLMDEGMELALGFHAANNLVGALLITSDWTAFQTHSILKDLSEPSAGFDVILPVFVVFPLLIYVFAKKYQWNNWSDKLTGKLQFNTTETL